MSRKIWLGVSAAYTMISIRYAELGAGVTSAFASPSSSAFRAAVLQLTARILAMVAQVGGEEWGRFRSSSTEGTTRTFFFGREEPGP